MEEEEEGRSPTTCASACAGADPSPPPPAEAGPRFFAMTQDVVGWDDGEDEVDLRCLLPGSGRGSRRRMRSGSLGGGGGGGAGGRGAAGGGKGATPIRQIDGLFDLLGPPPPSSAASEDSDGDGDGEDGPTQERGNVTARPARSGPGSAPAAAPPGARRRQRRMGSGGGRRSAATATATATTTAALRKKKRRGRGGLLPRGDGKENHRAGDPAPAGKRKRSGSDGKEGEGAGGGGGTFEDLLHEIEEDLELSQKSQPGRGGAPQQQQQQQQRQRQQQQATASNSNKQQQLAAVQQLAPGAPPPLDDEQGGEEDEDAEEAEALLEQLGGAGEKPAQLADYFEGHELPCPHVAKQWPRSEMYRDRTSHYDPRMVGDHARGALLTKLERIAEAQLAAKESAWATTYAYESKSLVSGISFLADLRLHLESLGVTLATGPLRRRYQGLQILGRDWIFLERCGSVYLVIGS